MILIAGPCVIESEEVLKESCNFLKKLSSTYGLDFYFKSSYDKANRSSANSFRGPGLDKGLRLLENIKKEFDVKIVTDVHLPADTVPVAQVADVLQIPAFLCRQTDMLKAAAETGKCINVKKGQFMAPWDMKEVVNKLNIFNCNNIMLTERGSSFGYNNLVVDYRSFPIMKAFGVDVIFDATHSVQLPGGQGNVSGGQREFVPYLARAAAACGVDGFFMEIHPDPDSALCDGPNMINFEAAEKLIKDLVAIRESYESN